MKKIINGFLIGIGVVIGAMLALAAPSMIAGYNAAQLELDSHVYCTAAEFDSDLLNPEDYDEWEQEWTIVVPPECYPNNTDHEITYHVTK